MPMIHDPYLDTVRRSLNEERMKLRKNKVLNSKKKPNSFLSKEIIVSDYIYLPESLQNFFLLTLFITIPYLIGIFLLLLIFSQETYSEYINFTFDSFIFTWTVGYEGLTILLILLIIKSAFTFKAS